MNVYIYIYKYIYIYRERERERERERGGGEERGGGLIQTDREAVIPCNLQYKISRTLNEGEHIHQIESTFLK